MFSYMNRGKAFYRDVVLLAIPIILQNLITNSLGLLDTFMVGMLGEAPMAAVTLANIPIFVVQLMTFGLQSGASVLISQFYGKGDKGSINEVLGIGFAVAGGITLIFGCIMFFLPVPFMALFGNNADVVALAAQYARIVAFSFLFDSLAQVYIAAHRSMANPLLGLYILGASMISNTVLNWVFIFGKLGAPAMGVEGAALATLISRVLEFVIAVGHIALGKRFRLQFDRLLHPSPAMLGKYVRFATPVLLNETLWGLGTSLYPTIMGHMEGSQAILAAYGIVGNLVNVSTVMVFAIGGTTAIIIGREIGAGRREGVYEKGLCLDMLAFLAGLVVGAVFIVLTYTLFEPVVYPLFHLSQEASEIATMMSLVSFAILSIRSFNTTNVVGVLRGGGDVRAASVIDLAPMWLLSLPLAALAGLVFHWGILPVYLCISLDNVVKLVLGVWRLRSGVWIRDLTSI
ncbi:MAG: MATE family efflux transporter [Oscillospiraceae bacterium]|nr:MATE family efflux transporter [Oscillospiraceae bacterium]